VKSFLGTRSVLGKSLLVTVSILFLTTSCSSGNEKASSEPTVSPSTEIVTSSPTPDPTPTPAVSPSTEPSPTPDPTPTSSTQPRTKESESAVTPSAAPTPKKSKTPSKPSPSTKKLTNAELLLKYPPTIGALVPWYNLTPEQAGKAYTNLKPYEVGENYALYQEEGTILFVYPTYTRTNYIADTFYWHAVRLTKLKASDIEIWDNYEGMLAGYKTRYIYLMVCVAEGCANKISGLLPSINLDPDSMFQTWGTIRTN